LPVSDTRGRSFEHCVSKSIFSELQKLFPGRVFLTSRAREAQSTGLKHCNNLSKEQKNRFEKSGLEIAKWLAKNKFSNTNDMKFETQIGQLSNFLPKKTSTETIEKIELDRIPDSAGVQGDVTDIRLTLFSENKVATLNISLKHSHEALKHPRLTRVPNWISLESTTEARKYLEDYKEIWASFFKKGKLILPGAKRFSELKSVDANIIEANLYKPLYQLVGNFLAKNIVNEFQTKHLFEFMVGRFNFIKFVDYDGQIEIRDFSNIRKPSSVKVGYTEKGYLQFTFDNGWMLSGRLHTATEWLKESIKFDMQPENLNDVVPAIHLSTHQQGTL
jgi:hypothetical protein